MGVASIAPAYAGGPSYAKNADRAPFDDRPGGLVITGSCIAFVDRDGDLNLRMVGHGFNSGQEVVFGTQAGQFFGLNQPANDLGDVNFLIVIEGYNGPAEFACVLGIVGQVQAIARIDLSV
jgi:hypothetical protein